MFWFVPRASLFLARLPGFRVSTAPPLIDELAHEGDGLLRIVDVARPVLDAQDVASLGDVGEQRVVAEVFPMMGIEAPEDPADLRPGAHDGAVDVYRQPGKPTGR